MTPQYNRRYLTAAMDAAGLPEAWRRGLYRAADAHETRAGLVGSDWLAAQCVALEKLARGHVPIDATSHDVRDRAEALAVECAEAWRRDWSCDWDARAIVMREGEEWPGIGRATCRNWWRRRIMRSLNRRTENAARDLVHVGGRGPAYVSDETHARYLTAKRLSESAIDSAWLDEIREGVAAPLMALRDAIDSSVSNPTIRLAELITRARGMEEIADERGDVGLFWTWTLPSSYHATRKNGTLNHRWQGQTVRDGADALLRNWKTAQDALREAGLLVYGVRIMEPHTDGTPHAHALLWCPADLAHRVKAIIYRAFLRDAEVLIPYTFASSHRYRVKCMPIDRSKGNGISYLVKYLTKNLTDEHQLNKRGRGVSRVKAWASAHAIRQFQFIGGPPVQTWREARRLTQDQAMECEQFALAFDAVHRVDADDGGEVKQASFAKFIRIQGGIEAKRAGRPIVPLWESRGVNRYGEQTARVAGLQCGLAVALTRSRTFAIRWGGHRAGRVFGSDSRTRFNNFGRVSGRHDCEKSEIKGRSGSDGVGVGQVGVDRHELLKGDCQGFSGRPDLVQKFISK